jgi:hypothetical protein
VVGLEMWSYRPNRMVSEKFQRLLKKKGGTYLGEDAGKNFWDSRHKMFSLMNKEGTYDSIDTAVL